MATRKVIAYLLLVASACIAVALIVHFAGSPHEEERDGLKGDGTDQEYPNREAPDAPAPQAPVAKAKVSSSYEALIAVSDALAQHRIRPTLIANNLGISISGSGTTAMPHDNRERCPADSFAASLSADHVVGHFYSLEQTQTIWLAYCVDRFSGKITPANDYARQLTYIEDAAPNVESAP